MYKIHGECDAASAATQASFAKCDKGVKKLETHLRNENALIHKVEPTLAEHKTAVVAPHILAAYEKLTSVELQLKVAEFENKRMTDECERLRAKHLDVIKSEIRYKKENKQLTKTVETLTAQLEGKASPQVKSLQNENGELKKQLALLTAQLANKTEECEAKDLIIKDLRDDFAAYQSVADKAWSHRHDACNELSAALEEQCEMYKTQQATLEGNLNTLHHKCNSLVRKRDCHQEQFDESIKAHKMELEDLDTSKCEGSQGCTSCVVHLERALRISRAAEDQALQLVDQVNHDRMVA